MNSKLILFLTRVLMGWMFFYAGITKVLNPNWSAAGYLGNAKTFAGLYNWFLQPEILPFTNFVNEWGLTLLGVSLIVGALVKYSGYLGALLMLLYYFPVLDFPKVGANSYLVDDHIIFIAVLLCFVVIKAGEYWGFDGWWKSRR
ncbi:MAG: hypothetical protein A2651_02125 [Candidatus Yanofskybacteria bacterium RIFCSPHIGHO2_01_FULL_42_12]|uniref:DoxX subfamily n=1 Tax=Candidatus Yanofskybacteria bacterium RIFCSPLOWO2_01_FULL_42_49 TaxID=1802694 RepID=A0A1F8GCA2_9BACT|nr:MAG: hypothetical protein A2651_02125 [Candidatus Yanofskybacteria bacterium RIFCSPHIGHO2_01_FULL_42_12]OGN22670.1 MAG: hypothetical protein A2918_01040 [Candidatus Yanofskybacteria bacterium RIFCSPLOWO2_01_FULL_42_49]